MDLVSSLFIRDDKLDRSKVHLKLRENRELRRDLDERGSARIVVLLLKSAVFASSLMASACGNKSGLTSKATCEGAPPFYRLTPMHNSSKTGTIAKLFKSLGREPNQTTLFIGSRCVRRGWGRRFCCRVRMASDVRTEMFAQLGIVPGNLLDLVQSFELVDGLFTQLRSTR